MLFSIIIFSFFLRMKNKLFITLIVLQATYLLAYAASPPVLISPKNDAKGVRNRYTEFEWNGQERYYNLQIALDTAFTKILFNADSLSDLTYTYQDELQLKTKYFWRVRGGTEGGRTEWSQIFSMTITGLPDPPILAIPLDKSIDVAKEIVFAWSENPEAEYYHIQVSTLETFNSNRAIDQANIIEAGYETIYLLPKTKYYWHVRGMNKIGVGNWSPTWTLTTGDFIPSGVTQPKVFEDKFSISPNPASNLVNIEFNLLQNCEANVKIINNISQEVLTHKIQARKGDNYFSINLKDANLCKGSYLLMLQAGKEQKYFKLMVE